MKRALVVAHPDDEVLWAGGLVISHPGDWTILCATIPRTDPIRAVKFQEACKVLGAEGQVFPQTEPPPNESISWLDEIDLSGFDHIVTHNAFGEYGHQHHRDVHRHITRKYGKKKLTFFGYYPKRPAPPGFTLRLSEFEVARKLKALKCYDHLAPYEGGNPPKWEALLDRYMKKERIPFDVETFDGPRP